MLEAQTAFYDAYFIVCIYIYIQKYKYHYNTNSKFGYNYTHQQIYNSTPAILTSATKANLIQTIQPTKFQALKSRKTKPGHWNLCLVKEALL